LDIRSLQKLVVENKRRQGFNLNDVPLELCLLQSEIAEFFQSWRRKQADVGEELADIAIYVLGLAEIVGIDLETEISRKVEKNARRVYVEQNGVLVKAEEAVPS
jgi:NTP pyrophosphatase (non-canonical NTP hydrolase)